MLTLWDLIDPLLDKLVASSLGQKKARGGPPNAAPVRTPPTAPPSPIVAPAPAAPVTLVQAAEQTTRPVPPTAQRGRKRKAAPARDESADASMQEKYDAVVELMLARYQIRVRKWRTAMTGVAWYIEYRDGRRVNLIEAPRPRGPMSAAVFLHEIGHHAIGFDVYKPRCLEEFHAWRWSLEAMAEHGLNISDQVRLRMHQSLWYAVQKAKRRGIKQIPAELTPFLEKPRMRMRPASRRR